MEGQAFELLMMQLKKMESDQDIIREELKKQGEVLIKNTESLIHHMSRTEANEELIAQLREYIFHIEKKHNEYMGEFEKVTEQMIEDLKMTKNHVLKVQRWGRTLTPTPKKVVTLSASIAVLANYFTSIKQWVITFLSK